MDSDRPARSADVVVGKARQVAEVLLYESFGPGDLGPVRARCYKCALDAGLTHERALMFTSSINEAMLTAVQHGGGHWMVLVLRDIAQRLSAEVLDVRPPTVAAMAEHLPPARARAGEDTWSLR